MYIGMQDQISGLKPELGCYQNHKQLLEQEQLKLRQRVEIIQKKIMLKNGNIILAKFEFSTDFSYTILKIH